MTYRKPVNRSKAFLIAKAGAGYPVDSWWTRTRTREDFDREAEQAGRRMRDSKYGRVTHGEAWASV